MRDFIEIAAGPQRSITMQSIISTARLRARPFNAFLGRSFALTKRYWLWEASWLLYSIVMVLSIGFLAVGVGRVSGVQVPVDKVLVYLLTGSLLYRYLSELFWETSNIISYERWEGTIEHTFMAPVSRVTHLLGMSAFSVCYAGGRLVLLTAACALMFDIHLASANLPGACAILAISTFSLVGLGLMAASLPLIYTEKGTQMTNIVEAALLMVSGVYYPVDVLPAWLRFFSRFSPATYTLHGMRAAILDGARFRDLWGDILPLIVTAVILIPLGLKVFGIAETYCKRHGKLKRSG
jgi:ABC-2 type transport system permease protein